MSEDSPLYEKVISMANSPLYGDGKNAYILGLHALTIAFLAKKATGVTDFQDSLIRLSFREARLMLRSGNHAEMKKVLDHINENARHISAMPEFKVSITHEPWVTALAQELGNLLAGLEVGEHTPATALTRLQECQRLLAVAVEGEP